MIKVHFLYEMYSIVDDYKFMGETIVKYMGAGDRSHMVDLIVNHT